MELRLVNASPGVCSTRKLFRSSQVDSIFGVRIGQERNFRSTISICSGKGIRAVLNSPASTPRFWNFGFLSFVVMIFFIDCYGLIVVVLFKFLWVFEIWV